MTGQKDQDRMIHRTVAAAVAAGIAPVPPRRLCAGLRRRTKELRQHYLRASAVGHSHLPWEEWLCDNYYVLEKESKQTVRDIRHLTRKGDSNRLAGFYTLVRQTLRDVRPEICDETVTEILDEISRHSPICELQFSFVPSAIRAALIELARDACDGEGSAETIGYAVTGLIRLSAVDMDGIIRRCSDVEAVLLQDPAGIYPLMSRDSRRHYRHLVAKIAAKTGESEVQTAKGMLQSCRGREGARAHIGAPILESGYVVRPRRVRGCIALGAGILLPLLAAVGLGLLSRSLWVAVITCLPLWEIFRTVIQQVALTGLEPDFIPRMNLKKVDDKPKTVVLVSTLLPKAGDAPALRDRLEQLYFSNSDPDMYYCILADLGEWPFPTNEKDESEIAATRRVIEALNRKYRDRFMLFLRARTFNRTQNRYSGWERKRGAITEFIRFLKGDRVSLHTFVGDESVLGDIRYLIALDADTSLLYESAQTLVSAAIHPLNRPVIGEDGVVTSGYGILVPGIIADLESARQTAFSRVMTGMGGVTAYETRDKDFYQDLFSEGIFAGKGLIDVDCFYQLLNDRFPENQVLSHDILEGAYLRAGLVSDAEMGDSTPRSMLSWLARLHRWLRGDWQNLKFIQQKYKGVDGKAYVNPINTLSRYKLFDNLRRSLTPVTALLCIFGAVLLPRPASWILAVCGVLAVTFPSLWAACWALFTGGTFTLSRKFFTRTLPHTLELMAQGAIFLIMLPAQAIVTVDAALRSLWRLLVSRKNLLEWQTAAQSDTRGVTLRGVLRRFWLAEVLGLLYIAAAAPSPMALMGVVFCLVMPVAWSTSRVTAEEAVSLSTEHRDTLLGYNAAMWRYYEEFANAENHFLPPDNIQQSPVYRVAARTSPTNIGMMLLSVLAARDMDLIDTNGLYLRVERTLSTVERLKKWNGNLINWYDTATLETLKPEFVSTVDSGNFICCLVALAQGLREFIPEKREFRELADRVERLVEDTDLTVFYNRKKHLFSIGWDMEAGALVGSHYDFLMSEARLTSYYAVARKIVGKRHWGTLNRTMSRQGSYAGAVSWTGTMFEYFMPHLLLPVWEGSLLSEALVYCLYCHKKRVKGLDVPWGISESAFYAFDNNLNYQYKAHGVQKLGVKRHLDRELVISPYSTFITIPMNPNSSMANLRRLRELGVYGRYGFYEAVDFTAERVGRGALSVTRSYMAHHIGMSMVASCNALFDNKMQKRFMRDPYMRSAREFLQEKITKSTVVYDDLTNAGDRGEKHERPRTRTEGSAVIDPRSPRCVALTNGEISDIITDTGMGYLKFGEIDLTRRSGDLLRRAQGIVALVRFGGRVIPATMAPFYREDVDYSVEYQEQGVTWYARHKEAELGMRAMVHPTISCQQRQLVIKNVSSRRQLAQVLFYFEPVLSRFADYDAHPAYSKLFVGAVYDSDSRTLTFSRRNRDSTENMFLTVGFLQDIDFSFETRREMLQSAPNGLEDLLNFQDKSFSGNGGGVPDACCALKFDLLVNAGSQAQATLLLCAARSRQEGISGIISMRSIGALDDRTAAKSPLLGDSLEGRLGSALLSRMLYAQAGTAGDPAARESNRQGQSALWCTGISGDLPIALLELSDRFDATVLDSYIRIHRSMRSLPVEFDLCILYGGEDPQRLKSDILTAVERGSVSGILGSRGGIFLLEKSALTPELYLLLRAVARHIATDSPSDLVQAPGAPWRPMTIRPVAPALMPQAPDLAVEGGAFHQGRFFVDRQSPLPWCHILAGPAFGTLVSDQALGYTWAVNARENRLTPWYNDICTDNQGELLLLRDGDGCHDLIRGSRASFSQEDARYQGRTGRFDSDVTVTVKPAGCAKYVDLKLTNRQDKPALVQCAYYTEPVLGVTRETSRYICAEAADRGRTLVLRNPWNTAVRCCSALTARTAGESETVLLTDRAAFLEGDWVAGDLKARDDLCAAVVVSLEIPAGGRVDLRFALGFGMTAESAARMVSGELAEPPEIRRNSIRVRTPSEAVNQYVNHFAPHQILASRIRGRTAFYQCGGAYGFRDQLQDAAAYLLLDSQVTRRQILRCCGVQFEEGDVLHWWHPLPKNAGGLKGVRTRFSDDLLWLPMVTAEYLEKTGNTPLLDTRVPFLTAPELAEGEHEKYISPARSGHSATVYEHCLRAIERACRLDSRGIPLIGCGDWNDGFSAVGLQGKGSSVWLAMFLSMVLERFAPVCRSRGDKERAERYHRQAEELRAAVDRHCWDGGWYIRAFYDDGGKMGTHHNRECSIDLLPQSFAVLCGMPDRERVEQGLDNALRQLVDRRLRLVRLFTMPFQHSLQQPGYVKAYPPGIRENGGQYTHSAIWFAMALLEAGRVEEGAEILTMLCPADRACYPDLARQYRLEPYYIAADIYTNPNAPGRGGWSLYTGAAAWYYRAVVETLLGLRLEGDRVTFRPRLPRSWPSAGMELELSGTRLEVEIRHGAEEAITCDGKPVKSVPLDGGAHSIRVTVARAREETGENGLKTG